ncbi:hypothetical protein Tco_0559373 [Tanacetum coccineum]
MEVYIRLEEEKAQKHRKVFNWETAKYGKICKFFNDEIDFRISFDDSDDEDYTRPRTECLKFYNLWAILVDFTYMALPPRDQRLQYLRYKGLQYTDADIMDFETRLARIYRREVHRVQGLTVIAPALPVIDMAELVRLQICVEIDDTWAWVTLGPERQPDSAAGAPEAAEDAPVDDEGGQAILAPVQAPQPPPPQVAARTMPQRLGRLEEKMQGLRRDVRSLRGLVERSMTDQGRFSTWMISCMA